MASGFLPWRFSYLGDELLHDRARVADEVVIGEVRAFDRLAADLDHRRRVPAVAADERHGHAEVAGLDGDLSDLGVEAGDEQHLRLRGSDRRELRAELGVAAGVALLGDDLSARASNSLRKNSARPTE